MSVQPISTGAVVSRIWQIYRDQFGILIAIALVIYAIEFVLDLLLSSAAGLSLLILSAALGILYQGMVVKLVQDVQDGRRDHSVGDLIRSVERVFWPLVAVSILFGVAVAIGFVLLIIPGVILMVLWAVVAPVTVLEHPGVFAAFGRSRELVRGNAMSVFGVIVVVFLAVLVAAAVASVVAAPLGAVGRGLILWVVTAALAPATALSASVLYFALLSGGVPVG
jgi:hypothetical protein